jgi:ABC-type sugar transport system permease subunit
MIHTMMSQKAKVKARMGVLFTLPGFLFVFIFMIFPLATSFWYSFTDYNFVYDLTPAFVGLKNYIASFSDQTFLLTMKNTFVFAFFYFMSTMLTALLFALLIFYYKGKSAVFKTCIFMPIVVPLSLASILFNWIFAENFGLLNFILADVLNLPQLTFGWLTNRVTAMGAIISVTSWSSVGFLTILFLAGLQGISSDVLEAAKIDGASTFQTILKVILPNLRETYVITGIWAILRGLKIYAPPMVMTGGAPGNSTRVMYMHIYDNAFEYFEMGYASAIGFILSIIVLVFSFLNMKLNSSKE